MAADDQDLQRAAAQTRTGRSGSGVSVPTRLLIKRGLLQGDVLHHGRGNAVKDSEAMRNAGHNVVDYDVNPADDDPGLTDRSRLNGKYHTVVSNYVANVVPPAVREHVFRDIAGALHPEGTAYVTARGAGDKATGTPHEDGVITSRGTFQALLPAAAWSRQLQNHFHDVEVIKGSDKSSSVTLAARRPKA